MFGYNDSAHFFLFKVLDQIYFENSVFVVNKLITVVKNQNSREITKCPGVYIFLNIGKM